jgi:UDP-glucose 4-epimerase
LQGSRVLITGGAGFIGSHLAEVLLQLGCQVTVIDDLSTGRFANINHLTQRYPIADNRPSFRFAIDSITNQIVMDRLVSQCDVVFHLAAAVGVKLIVQQPVRTIATNVIGADAVLRTALRYRVKVILASSSEVYGKGSGTPFSEDDDVLLGPTSRTRWAYAASKMVDEFLALAYHRENDLPVVIVRLFNIVGPRQTGQYGMVLPRFVEQALTGQPLTVYGNGQQSRCFLHVKDAVKAFVTLAEHPEAVGSVFNVGATAKVTILGLANAVLEKVRKVRRGELCSGDRIRFVPYEEAYAVGFEDMLERVPNIGRVQKLTGWRPQFGLGKILNDIIRFSQSECPSLP